MIPGAFQTALWAVCAPLPSAAEKNWRAIAWDPSAGAKPATVTSTVWRSMNWAEVMCGCGSAPRLGAPRVAAT